MALDRADIAKALRAKGFALEQGKRDHDVLVLRHHGLKRAIFTKLSRGRQYKTIGKPLVSRMSKQLHLSKSQFSDLVSCPLSGDEYLSILREKSVLSGD